MNDAHDDHVQQRDHDHDVGEDVRLCKDFYLPDPAQQGKNDEANAGGDPLVVLRVNQGQQDHVEVEYDEADVGAAETCLRKEQGNVY